MNKSSLAARAACVAALVAVSAPCLAIDLLGSYEKALQVDPSMKAADAAVLAGRERAVQGAALLLPQVSLSGDLVRVHNQSSTGLPAAVSDLIKSDSSGNVHEVALQLVQPLYNARAAADKKQSLQHTELAEVEYRHAQQELLQRVGEAYFNLLLAQESLRVAEAEKAAVGQQRERAQARFDVGRGKVTEVQEAQARYDTVLTREVSAQSTLALRQAQFQELTGVPGEGLADLRSGFGPESPTPDSLQAWQQKGLDGNTRVLVKRSELAIAGAEIDKYKLSGRPTLDLVASYTKQGQNGGLSPLVSPDNNRAAVVGVQFNVPLYTGGALNSRERESIARKVQAEQDLIAAQRDVRLQVQDAFLAVKTGVSRVAAQEQSVRSARTALEATTLGRDLGTRTELDVLDAQQRLYSTQLELAQGRHDYLLGRIRLAQAAGELQLADLRSLNGYLAP
jgi:outer membrane protein